MTTEEIAELKRLIAEATPRPWHFGFSQGDRIIEAAGVGTMMCDMAHDAWCPDRTEDWELIVAAVNALPALIAEVEKGPKWIPVTQVPEHGRYQVWIPNASPRGGYYDTAVYGIYICEREDVNPGDKGYVEDNDEGNFQSEDCWYRIEDAHGGG